MSTQSVGGQAEARSSGGRVTQPRLVMGIFFLQAITFTSWFPRIPDVQHQLGLSPAVLSLCLIGGSLGSFFTTLFTGPLIDRFTPRVAMQVGMCLFYSCLLLPGLAWDAPSLFVAMGLTSAAYVAVDIAMNVEAARAQEAAGRRIMSTCHGFWSIGSVCGSALGGQLAQAAVPPWLHLLLVGVIALPVGLILVRSLPPATAVAEMRPRRPVFVIPTLALAGLCIYAFGAIVGELATRNWAAVYLRDTILASGAASGWGLALFSLFMAIGRFAGDRLTDRFGPVAIGRTCAAIAVAGVAALVVATSLPLALAGLAAIGLGVSVGFPLAVSAAAARGDRPAALNVAGLSLAAYSGSLVGPPVVGFVAQGWGLRAGLAALLPLLALSVVFAGQLGRRASVRN